MKRYIFLALMLSALVVNTSYAQNEKNEKKSLKSQVSGLWKKTKTGVSDATQKVADAIGFNDAKVDEYKVGDTYYMPIYSTNLYKGNDAQTLKAECEKLFKARYPQAIVLTEAIPQVDWLTQPVEQNDKVIGYTESLFCYILARDGGDGYINAKYVFQQYKDVGKSFNHVVNKWPANVRTDIIPNADYAELQKKMKSNR